MEKQKSSGEILMSQVFCFGDSHGAGAELKSFEHPFVHWFAKELDLRYHNFSQEGASLGYILYTVVKHHQLIKKDDIVLVVIPPDTRWYDENEKDGFYSLMNYMKEDYYNKFLNKKTLEWFEYHHALFTYNIQKILQDIGCQYTMILAYGRLGGAHYNLNIDHSKFLSDRDLINLLSIEQPEQWDNYPHDIVPKEHRFMFDGPPDIYDKTSPYYQIDGKPSGHPNELGHKYIAKLLVEKMNNDNFKK